MPNTRVMNNVRFVLLVLPSTAVLNLALLIAIIVAPWKNTYVPTTTEVLKSVIFGGFLSVLLLILNKFKTIFKISDHNLFNTHIQPMLKEIVKYLVIAFIALHETDQGTWESKLTVYQVVIIIGIFMGIILIEFIRDFMPSFYFKTYDVFLKLYDDLLYMENYDDESRNEVTMKIVESLKRYSVGTIESSASLAGVLPREIAVADISFESDTSELDLKFNNDVFDPRIKPMKLSPVLKRSPPSSPQKIQKYKSCYDLVDKLYSVSPKNTFHLITASATVMTRDDVDLEEDSDAQESQDINVLPFLEGVTNDLDNASIHTTDTDFNGGGGGGFKYKMPNGGKILFGGGGGFSYKHGKKPSMSSSCKSADSSKRLNEHHKPLSKKFSSWILPPKPQNSSVKKKLSMFSFNPDEPTLNTHLLDCEQPRYDSTENSKNRIITKLDFDNYVYVSLGIDKFKIEYDPVFEKYGKGLIRDMNYVTRMLCYLNKLVWVFGSLFVYCIVFLNDSRNYLLAVVFLKLFNVNLLNNVNMKLTNLLLVKILVNLFIFSILIVL